MEAFRTTSVCQISRRIRNWLVPILKLSRGDFFLLLFYWYSTAEFSIFIYFEYITQNSNLTLPLKYGRLEILELLNETQEQVPPLFVKLPNQSRGPPYFGPSLFIVGEARGGITTSTTPNVFLNKKRMAMARRLFPFRQQGAVGSCLVIVYGYCGKP